MRKIFQQREKREHSGAQPPRPWIEIRSATFEINIGVKNATAVRQREEKLTPRQHLSNYEIVGKIGAAASRCVNNLISLENLMKNIVGNYFSSTSSGGVQNFRRLKAKRRSELRNPNTQNRYSMHFFQDLLKKTKTFFRATQLSTRKQQTRPGISENPRVAQMGAADVEVTIAGAAPEKKSGRCCISGLNNERVVR